MVAVYALFVTVYASPLATRTVGGLRRFESSNACYALKCREFMRAGRITTCSDCRRLRSNAVYEVAAIILRRGSCYDCYNSPVHSTFMRTYRSRRGIYNRDASYPCWFGGVLAAGE